MVDLGENSLHLQKKVRLFICIRFMVKLHILQHNLVQHAVYFRLFVHITYVYVMFSNRLPDISVFKITTQYL